MRSDCDKTAAMHSTPSSSIMTIFLGVVVLLVLISMFLPYITVLTGGIS